MTRLLALTALLSAIALAQPALSAPPPSDAKPLSEIIKAVEDSGDVAYIDEVEWDDDDGHWEIEYYKSDRSKVEVEYDPVTGTPR